VESTQGNGEASIGHRAMTVVADQPAGGLPEFRLRRVTRYVQDNLHRELRLAELSGLVHMSPYHFARLFKRSTGVSPHRFLVRRRIEQASALLAAQTLSIAEIARSVGFRTPSHFTTTFRRVTGITPSVYRCSTLCAISRQSLPAASVVGTVASFCSRATTSRYVASKCVASCRGPSSRIAAFGPGSLDDPVRPPGRPKNFSERISPRQRLVTIVLVPWAPLLVTDRGRSRSVTTHAARGAEGERTTDTDSLPKNHRAITLRASADRTLPAEMGTRPPASAPEVRP